MTLGSYHGVVSAMDTLISVSFKASVQLLVWRNIKYLEVKCECQLDVKYAKYKNLILNTEVLGKD